MSIKNEAELNGMQMAAQAVALTLKAMREFVRPGMSTKELDEFGGKCLSSYGARSAPFLTYKFPGYTCISLNNEIAHGIPSATKMIHEGDLLNIDVSAELNGYWADNGGSFVVGNVPGSHAELVNASRAILHKAIAQIRSGVRIAEVGAIIQKEAKKRGYKVIKNLCGHGIGHALHEEPSEIPNYYDRFNTKRFRKNSVVAIETFISTHSSYADTLSDGWTLVGDKGGYVAQHEHTIVVTDHEPIILTGQNEIWVE